MTEKRFIVIDDGLDFMVRDIVTGDDLIDADGVTDVLNDYEKENEQLKKQLIGINQLIDNKIDEFKNGDYGDLPCNTIHMFLDLKQEMEDLE